MKQMKTIQYMCIALLSFLGLSCEKQIVSGLDGSVDARINAMINGYVDELTSSEYGWMASIGTSEGYYRFYMEFQDSNKVVMLTDNPQYGKYKTTPETSTYVFKALQRPTLIFDTYSYLSLINDPGDDISGGDRNQGLVTDFEFEVEKYENGVFYMVGRFNKVKAVFRKASLEDKEGAEQGLMVENLARAKDRLMRYYITASLDDAEIVVKVVDERSLYVLSFDDKTETGEESEKFYNIEVNGTEDLFFPEPINVGRVSITGLRYDPFLNEFTEFYTSDGERISVEVSFDPPRFPLSKIFGYRGDGKVFDGLVCPPTLTTTLPGGTTKSSLDIMGKFISKGIILISYDVHYYFTNSDGNSPELNILFNPYGIDITKLVLVDKIAIYTFPITIVDDDYLSFSTSNEVRMIESALGYYNDGYMSQLVDNFKNKTFDIRWSSTCQLSTGLIVQMFSRDGSFVPPGLLEKR